MNAGKSRGWATTIRFTAAEAREIHKRAASANVYTPQFIQDAVRAYIGQSVAPTPPLPPLPTPLPKTRTIRGAVATFDDGDYWIVGWPDLGPSIEKIRQETYEVLEKDPVAIFIIEVELPQMSTPLTAVVVDPLPPSEEPAP